jgi:hypothetical protein
MEDENGQTEEGRCLGGGWNMCKWRMEEDVQVEDGRYSARGWKMFRWRMEDVQVEDERC